MAKKINFIIALTVGFLFNCTACLGLDDFSIDNNLGAPRLPTSDARDSFVVQSPLSSNSNLVVTGNVRGGKHFRGFVPYRATSDFGTALGSGELGSFLRRSAPVSYRTSPGTYQPYYLPSETVTAIRRGFVSGLSGASIRLSGGSGNFVPLTPQQALALEQFGPRGRLGDIYEQTRPLSMSPYDTQRLITEDYRKQNQKELAEALRKSKNAISGEEVKERIVDKSQRPPVPEKPEFEILEPDEALNPETFYFPEEEIAQQDRPDVFEQMRHDIQQQFDEELLDPKQKKVELPEKQYQKTPAEREDIYKFSIKDIDPATAKAMRGVHKTFATRSEDKFNNYLRAAEDLMKQGKFYQAANAYTLASLYKPDDPLPYAGKSHALFASGEYMSSAYFLAKAINMFGEYVKFRVDLLAMIGDLDKLENRIADVAAWQKKSDSAELQFLLGYVYYQTGKLENAKEAIDGAAEKIPESFAVSALKKVIDAEIGAGNN